MDRFDNTGHLTEETLRAFAVGDSLSPLERLEIAEHLDFCDDCLMRSMALLPETALLTPSHSCQLTLWRRIHLRAARMLTSRYATAAAAVVIVAALWNLNIFGNMVTGSAQLADTRLDTSIHLSEIAQSISDGLRQFTGLFDFRGAPDAPRANLQGGTNS